jgi:hypothetical protein
MTSTEKARREKGAGKRNAAARPFTSLTRSCHASVVA